MLAEENDSLRKKVQELEAQIKKNKGVVAEASRAMNRIIELHSEVDTKKTELEKLQKSRDDAVTHAEGQEKEMERLKSELLSCMREAKALINAVFAKGGMEASEALPDADPKLFADWLSLEIGNFRDLLNGSLDIGACCYRVGEYHATAWLYSSQNSWPALASFPEPRYCSCGHP